MEMDGTRRARRGYLLLSRIVQLILAGSLETLLHTDISPQSRNSITDLGGKIVSFDLSWLHEDSLDVVLGSLVVKWKLKLFHGLENNAHRLNGIAEDNLLEGFPLIARVASLVDQLHLLQDRRLSRLSSSYMIISDAQLAEKSRTTDLVEAS